MTDKTAPEQEAPLTDEQIDKAAIAIYMWHDNKTAKTGDLIRELASILAPQPKGTRPLTEPPLPEPQGRGMILRVLPNGSASEPGPDRVYVDDLPAFSAEQMKAYAIAYAAALSAPRPLVAEPPTVETLLVWAVEDGLIRMSKVMDPDLQEALVAFAKRCRASLSPAPSITPEPPTATAILGAVARGWCHEKNAKKVMDSALAFAIVAEVSALIDRPAPDASSTVAPADARESLDHPISTSSAPSSSGGPSDAAPSALPDSADAARYRWLRDDGRTADWTHLRDHAESADQTDAYIDKRRTERP